MKEEFETPSAVELPKCTRHTCTMQPSTEGNCCGQGEGGRGTTASLGGRAIPSSTWCANMFSNPQVRPPPKLRPLKRPEVGLPTADRGHF